PASHCGLVGFKPSIGAIARGGGLPTLLLDFEVVGPMARRVADARLLFDALRGPEDGDRHSLAAAAARCGQRPTTGTLRVLYVPTLNQAPVDPEIAAQCAAACAHLTPLGHTVHTGELPLPLNDINRHWTLVGQIGLAALFDRYPAWQQGASAKYLAMAEQGRSVPASTLWALLDSVERLRETCAQLFQSWDIIAMPSAAALPWPATQAFPTEIAGQAVGPRGHAVFTGWVNAAGLPALSLPVEPSGSGLPIGLQLIGPYGADDTLFDLAQALESSLHQTHRWPSI
ncbi:MAG TPA: amidase, partial [Hydrogenophaga sp.]